MMKKIKDKLIPHLMEREGLRLYVYRDSLGKPTVGVGHLVIAKDGLDVGDKITKSQAEMFLAEDSNKAVDAAMRQAELLGLSEDVDFIVALASVNFQLGSGWINKWPNTWDLMRRGLYWDAIANIEGSLWAKQTPVRVRDFVSALRIVALRRKPVKNEVQETGKVVKMNFNKKGKINV